MKVSVFMILLLFFSSISSILLLSPVEGSGDAGASASIGVETPIPGNKSYRGGNVSLALSIYNGLDEPVNISVETFLDPMILLWSNYTVESLDPGARVRFMWLVKVPEDIGFGNYTLGFNITYVHGSEINNVYEEAWVDVIPRNITLLTADLYHNATGYYLVVSNPLTDPGQYIVENVSITIEPFNISVVPREAVINELYATSSYTIPLSISFNESDIGALTVNMTTHDDVHGLVYFNYTFIVVNATAYLDLRVVNDYGEPLSGAVVNIANGAYPTDSNGHISLVLPVGIYNYTVEYQGHKALGKIVLYTGYNQYTIIVDLTPPIILSARQEGYGIMVKAYDPGSNCSGVSSIIFVQGEKVWKYMFSAQRNISLMLYPSLKSGSATIIVFDAQGNKNSTTIQYIEPVKTDIILEVIIVFSIVFIALIALLLLTSNHW